MKNIIRTKSYWIVSILATAVIFAAISKLNNAYESEVDILVLAKSPQTLSAISQITADAQTIPLSLSFYNKLLENNPEIKDASAGLSDFQRKAFWDKKIRTKIINRSGVVRIEISDPDRSQAEIIASRTVRDLSKVFSRYYNIKTDLDIRIIDGPITAIGKKYDARTALPISLGIALLAVYISFALASAIEKTTFRAVNKAEKISILEQKIKPEFPVSSQEYQIVPKPKAKEDIKKEESSTRTLDKKAAAPSNLPIAEANFKESKSKAPTPEEVKERLNKLLSGKI
jgi:capsular polysaccharide biosynthesis protein